MGAMWLNRPSSDPMRRRCSRESCSRSGRAIEAAFQPVKMNYNLLGNEVPHLHAHVVPRYAEDPRPGWPFPFPEEGSPDIPEDRFRADLETLRRMTGYGA